MNFVARVVWCLCLISLAGCSLLPASGPQTSMIVEDGSGASAQWYQIVDVDEQVISTLSGRTEQSFLTFSEYKPASEPVVGVGDVVKITVWEAPPGNLFNANLSNSATSIGAAGRYNRAGAGGSTGWHDQRAICRRC